MIHSPRDAVAGEPRRQGLLVVGQRQRVRDRRRGLDLTAQRVERGELPRPRCSSWASRRRDESSIWHAVCRASTARAAAAAGLLISCARPAASVPRVTRDSRCRAVDSMDRAVLVQPLDEVPAEREPGVEPVTQHFGRHPEHPPGGRSPAGREIDAVLVPGAEPAGPAPGTSIFPTTVSSRPMWRTRSMAPSDEHPPEVRVLALAEQLDAGLDADLGAALDQLRELVVGQAVEEAERREARRRASDRGQVTVHEVDRHRALTDGRRDPLHGVEPDVAGREHARHAGLQGERRARQRPAPGVGGTQEVLTGDDEPLAVADDVGAEPLGAGRGADEDEQPARSTPPP